MEQVFFLYGDSIYFHENKSLIKCLKTVSKAQGIDIDELCDIIMIDVLENTNVDKRMKDMSEFELKVYCIINYPRVPFLLSLSFLEYSDKLFKKIMNKLKLFVGRWYQGLLIQDKDLKGLNFCNSKFTYCKFVNTKLDDSFHMQIRGEGNTFI